MKIGIPTEIKPMEARVALVPDAVADLVGDGHQLFVQAGAGLKSGYADEFYAKAGAEIVADAATLYAAAELVVKVKEPVAPELSFLRDDHTLFSYLHLAANAELTRHLQACGLTAIAFETVLEEGRLPLLAPMSDVAGRLSVQIGTTLLHAPQGGKGLLLGGLPAADRGHVVVLGAGNAGSSAALVAQGLGARVTVFDRKREKQLSMRQLGPNVTALYPYPDAVAEAVCQADLVVGAILIPGARAPHIVSREMVRSMAAGSVIIDISVDQGGCIETTRATDYRAPTYVEEGVVHFAVTNMPAAVARSATQALSAELIPYVKRLAAHGPGQDAALQAGINVSAGEIVHPAVRESLQ